LTTMLSSSFASCQPPTLVIFPSASCLRLVTLLQALVEVEAEIGGGVVSILLMISATM